MVLISIRMQSYNFFLIFANKSAQNNVFFKKITNLLQMCIFFVPSARPYIYVVATLPAATSFRSQKSIGFSISEGTVQQCRAARAARRSQRMPRGGIKATPAFASPHQNIACASFVGDPIPKKNIAGAMTF